MKRHAFFILLTLAIGACADNGTGDEPDISTDTDALAADADATADADADNPLCCPIGSPSCECFEVGGSKSDGCHSVCDAPPEGWTLTTDENGCQRWTGGSRGSCLAPGDIDGDTAQDPDASDAEVGPDAVECCEISNFPSCDCFHLGGSPGNGRPDACGYLCDAIPAGWEQITDINGCPMWVGGEPGSCIDPDPEPDAGPSPDADADADAD